MALILLGAALLLGAAVVGGLRLPLYPFEAVAMAVVLGLFGFSWLAFLAALVLPWSAALFVAVAVSVGTALFAARRRVTVRLRRVRGGVRAWVVWGAASGICAAVLVPLFWTHDLPEDAEGVWSAGSTWADFGLHASIVTHFAQFNGLVLDLPVASGTALTYPFLVDLLSSLLLRGGWSLHLALFVPGVLLALAIAQLVIAFGLRLFAHTGAAVLGLALFLLTGTAGGLPLAVADWRASGRSLGAFLADLPRDYATLSDVGGDVTAVVAHAMLPQRAILFGFGLTLVVLILLHATRATGIRRYLVAAGVLIGLMPFAHPHSFLACATVMAAVAVEAALRRRSVPWPQLSAGVLALVLAAPQLVWQQRANGNGTGGRFHLGWMVADGQSIWVFWAFNFGLMGVLAVALPFLLWRRALRRFLVWCVPALALLAVTQLYALQPFEYDDVKLIYDAYLLIGLLGAYLAVRAVRTRRWTWAALVPAVAAVILPGLLSLTYEFGLHDQFASPADVALAAWARADTPAAAVFLTTDRPNQPIATLGGRTIVMGYRGWLYNFSLPYDDRAAAVGAALRGHLEDPAVRRFHPDYLAVATNEDPSFPVDRTALGVLPVAYSNPEWTVYRLVEAATGAGQDARTS